mgnify:CR=1 FL=1|jgi:hypothetical protein
MIAPSIFLRRTILLDAVASGAMGLLLAPGADLLTPLLGLPGILLRESGLFLIVYAALIGWLGTRAQMPRFAVMAVIAGNVMWTIGSVALLVSGAAAPSMLGIVFVAMQAAAVAVFAELQIIGLKRSAAAVVTG